MYDPCHNHSIPTKYASSIVSQLSIARVGSTVNFWVVGPLYHLIEGGGGETPGQKEQQKGGIIHI